MTHIDTPSLKDKDCGPSRDGLDLSQLEGQQTDSGGSGELPYTTSLFPSRSAPFFSAFRNGWSKSAWSKVR
jgi:hypothetical protein